MFTIRKATVPVVWGCKQNPAHLLFYDVQACQQPKTVALAVAARPPEHWLLERVQPCWKRKSFNEVEEIGRKIVGLNPGAGMLSLGNFR